MFGLAGRNETKCMFTFRLARRNENMDCYELEFGRVAKPLAAKISPLVLTSSEIMATSS